MASSSGQGNSFSGGDDKAEVLRVLTEQLQEANRTIEEYRETLKSVLHDGSGSNDVVEIVEDHGEIRRLREQLTERENWIQALGDVVGVEGISDDDEVKRTRILEGVKEIKRRLEGMREVARPLVNLMKNEEGQGAAEENTPPLSIDQGSPPADLDISSPVVAGTSTSEGSSVSPAASTSTSSGSMDLFPNNSAQPEVNEGLGRTGRKRHSSVKEEEDSPPSQVRRQSDAAKFLCPLCNSAYVTFGKLKGHLFERHDNSTLLGYQEGCASCRKAYRSRIDLSQHVITEHGSSFITQDSNSISVIVNGIDLGNSSNEA